MALEAIFDRESGVPTAEDIPRNDYAEDYSQERPKLCMQLFGMARDMTHDLSLFLLWLHETFGAYLLDFTLYYTFKWKKGRGTKIFMLDA